MRTTLLFVTLLLAGSALAADQAETPAPARPDDAYPLQTCVVSGEKLGSMGEPYLVTHREAGKPDREVRLCCEMCKARFNSDPAKYLAKLDAAQAAAAAESKPGPCCCAAEDSGSSCTRKADS